MSRLTPLVDFIRSEENGSCWDDPTYRAYDLDAKTGEALCGRARRALGYSTLRGLRYDMVGLGYLGPVLGPLARWYVWDRLRTGECKTWKLREGRRKVSNPTPPKIS